MEVQGITPNEILGLRRSAGKAYGVTKRGSNTDLMWALSKWEGDPLSLASGPLRRYSWEWWHISQPGPQWGSSTC
eukprot:7671410-Pyramimonas_sp.AAC.1